MRTRDTDKQELVKQTAIQMIVEHGLESFSLNKLAKACSISVATLYIYYKDRDDLIISIAVEEAEKMGSQMLQDFDPELPFEEGLRQQWKNRAAQMLNNTVNIRFFEQLRTSSYEEKVHETFGSVFRDAMGRFMTNSMERGEIDPLPIEVYWSVAFAPLYNLIRFHVEGRSLAGKPFQLTDELMWQTFDLVLKALKK